MEIIFLTQGGPDRRRVHFGHRASLAVLGAVLGLVLAGGALTVSSMPEARAAAAAVASAAAYAAAWSRRHVAGPIAHVARTIAGRDPQDDAQGRPAGEDGAVGLLESEQERVGRAILSAQQGIDALALRLGTMQSHVTRLDALGSRLVEMAKLDPAEFAFSQPPARGGPRPGEERSFSSREFIQALDALERLLAERRPGLHTLETLLMSRRLQAEVVPNGSPVEGGFRSSSYGWRTDPLNGKRSFHRGLDFAGKPGTQIHVVASGVVVFSGTRSGYGNVVEVSHGDGYVTRYAHNQKNLVEEGDTVKKGTPIALLGATGRVSGPHVHFEVLEGGRAVNPIAFVKASTGEAAVASN